MSSKLPKAKTHAMPKPHMRTRKLSTTGKSAFAAAPGGGAAFPPMPMPDGGGAPAFGAGGPPDAAPGGAAPPMMGAGGMPGQ